MPKKSYHSKSWIWAFSSIYGTLLLCFFWESLKSPLPWSHTQWSEYLDLPWLGVSETSTTWTGCSLLKKKVMLKLIFVVIKTMEAMFLQCPPLRPPLVSGAKFGKLNFSFLRLSTPVLVTVNVRQNDSLKQLHKLVVCKIHLLIWNNKEN